MQKRTLGTKGLEVSALGAATLQLSAEDLGELEKAAARITVQGDRYPEVLERMTGR